MIEIGLLIFGAFTNNLALCIGWIFLSVFNKIPEELELVSVTAIIIIGIGRKLIKVGD